MVEQEIAHFGVRAIRSFRNKIPDGEKVAKRRRGARNIFWEEKEKRKRARIRKPQEQEKSEP